MLTIERRNRMCDLLFVLQGSCNDHDFLLKQAPDMAPTIADMVHHDLVVRTEAQTRRLLDLDSQHRGCKLQLRYVPQMPRPDEVVPSVSETERQRNRERLEDEIRARRALEAKPHRPSGPGL